MRIGSVLTQRQTEQRRNHLKRDVWKKKKKLRNREAKSQTAHETTGHDDRLNTTPQRKSYSAASQPEKAEGSSGERQEKRHRPSAATQQRVDAVLPDYEINDESEMDEPVREDEGVCYARAPESTGL